MNVYIFAKRVAIAAFVLLLIGWGFYLTGEYLYFMLLVFAGILLAVFFCSITDWITAKTHMNRDLSLFLSVVLVFGVIIGTFWLIGPTVANQFKQLGNTIPQSLNQLQDWLNQYSWGSQLLQKVPDDISVSNLISSGQGASGQGISGQGLTLFSDQTSLFSKITGFISSVFSFLIDLLIIIVTALYLAANPKLYTKGFASLFPVRNQERVLKVIDKVYITLKKWLISMLIIMTIVGVSAAIAYKVIDLPLAYGLAVLAFLFQFIPNIGPVIAAAPAVLIGLTVDPQTAVTVAVVFTLIQVIEGLLILPLLLERAIKLPPALLLFFQVFFGIVQGALGVLLAAPLLAVILVVVRELWIKDIIRAGNAEAREPVPVG